VKNKPDYVLHLAAETDVDRCEVNSEHAYKVNAQATKNLALACKESGSTMIYISTGYVFNGEFMREHTEYDIPDPLNVYAKSKYQGELELQGILDRFFIFRSDWMIGGGPGTDKKFVGKIVEQCKNRKEIQAANDISGNPTFARDFASGIKKVIKTGRYGLYHLVNKSACTRYDVALEIVKDMKADVDVIPVSSDMFPLPAPRPRSSALRNYKLELMGMDIMPNWKESLREYLAGWK